MMQKWPIMTASEMKFLKAEAQLRKNDRANAIVAYREGISLNFDHLIDKYQAMVLANKTLTTAKRDAYLAQPKYCSCIISKFNTYTYHVTEVYSLLCMGCTYNMD
jgi:hypothetical protein